MRVETVGFVTRVRLPDGKYEQSISLKNRHHKLAYEMVVEPKLSILTIKSVKAPYWATIVPLTNCSFIHLANQVSTAKKNRSTKSPQTAESMPKQTVLASKKPKTRHRQGKNGA